MSAPRRPVHPLRTTAALTVALSLTLAACSGSGAPASSPEPPTPSTALPTTPHATAPEPVTPAEPPSIDVGGTIDDGGNGAPVLQIKRSNETYRLNGRTPAAMAMQIRKRGPGKWAAHVSYAITFDVASVERDDGMCVLHAPRVRLAYTVVLPEVSGAVPVDARVYATRSIELLRIHENGHVQIARDTAKQTLDGLKAMRGRSFSSCERVETLADATGSRVIRQGQQRQARYDRVTRHGRRQYNA